MIAILLLALFVIFCVVTYCVTHSQAWHSYWVRKARKQESYLWSKAV